MMLISSVITATWSQGIWVYRLFFSINAFVYSFVSRSKISFELGSINFIDKFTMNTENKK